MICWGRRWPRSCTTFEAGLESCSRWPIALAFQVEGSTGSCVRAGVPGWLKWLYVIFIARYKWRNSLWKLSSFLSHQISVFKNYSVIKDASQDTAPIWSFLRKTWLILKCKENLLLFISIWKLTTGSTRKECECWAAAIWHTF